MGLIFPEEMYLFSGLKGTLTYEGKPQANVKIKLYIMDPNRDEEEHFYTTDENGFFEIPAITKKLRTAPLQQVVINSRIFAFYQDEEITIFSSAKHNGDKWSELGGEPQDLQCELTDERVHLTSPLGNLVTSSCRWTKVEWDPELPEYVFRGFVDHFTPKERKKKRNLNHDTKQQ